MSGGLVDIKYEILLAFDEFGKSFGEDSERILAFASTFLLILELCCILVLFFAGKVGGLFAPLSRWIVAIGRLVDLGLF